VPARPRSPSALLVSLPWTMLNEPSLGLGILAAQLRQAGVPCRVRHLNLFLLEHLKPLTYYGLANVFALNDFLFTGVIDSRISDRQRRWLEIKARELLSFGLIDESAHGGAAGVIERLVELRQKTIPEWATTHAEEIAESDATMVGFTCMFDQTLASAALAKLVKERAPEKLIALGGYAVRPPTDATLLRAFPWVDAVCVGEGESAIVPLVRASAGLEPLAAVPGLTHRDPCGEPCTTTLAPPVDLDVVPPPDYDDFYADLRELDAEHMVDIETERLPLENSRGCWWGATKHCVFCGIADDDLVFRARSAERVIADMDELHRRHGVTSFRFSDYILPHAYYRTLLPTLARRGRPYRITAEMKANVTPERFERLAAAGFAEMQPGVESFSNRVLRAMDKGVTGAQNVLTLKLGRQHGVRIHYNVLYGLPDDDAADYERMLASLRRLAHLDPPSTRLLVQITRFAPLQVAPERFDIGEAPYEPSYEIVFSERFLAESGFALGEYCYYFERPFENSPRLQSIYARIDELVDGWKAEDREREIELVYEVCGEGLRILDSRRLPAQTLELTGADAAVLLRCDAPMTRSALGEELPELGEGEIDAALARLDALELTFSDGERVIGLALPGTVPGGPEEAAAAPAAALPAY
jgi:ribosomal peptide maturation radical SAM protein 1